MEDLQLLIQAENYILKLDVNSIQYKTITRMIGGNILDIDDIVEIYNVVYNNDGATYNFTWTNELVEFHKENKAELVELGSSFCKDAGYSGIFSLLASFDGLKLFSVDEVAEAYYDQNNEYHGTIISHYVQFCLEEICNSVWSMIEDDEIIINECEL